MAARILRRSALRSERIYGRNFMKRITDKDFVYVSSDKTDVRQTFARIRKEREEELEREKQELAARLKNVISRRFK
jgi:hypothetical protein